MRKGGLLDSSRRARAAAEHRGTREPWAWQLHVMWFLTVIQGEGFVDHH